jgi:DNA-directed RNA polymerase specialized sigma24 family protein
MDLTAVGAEGRAVPVDADTFRFAFNALHTRLLAGDPNARDEVCLRAAPTLREHLRRWFPRETPDVVESGISDALMKYLLEPERYDPGRGQPLSWLLSIAYHSIVDAQRWWRRRWAHETFVGVDIMRFPMVAAQELSDQRQTWLRKSRETLLGAARSDEDRALILAKLDGAPGRVLAEAINVAHLPEGKQAEVVKRRWKTILRRLQRRRPGMRCPA